MTEQQYFEQFSGEPNHPPRLWFRTQGGRLIPCYGEDEDSTPVETPAEFTFDLKRNTRRIKPIKFTEG